MRKASVNEPTHVSTGNVFEDLGFPPEKALALKFKAKILTGILDEGAPQKISPGQRVMLLDEHQPVISNLLQGKISQMSIEKPIIYADRLGLKLEIQNARPHRRRQRVAYTTQPKMASGRLAGGKVGGKIGGKRA